MCSNESVVFFKQKTAYEMRISAWSSDVCSSDLVGAKLARAGAGGGMSADEVRQFRVSADDDGIRLDRWFKRHMAEATYTVVAKWARTGQSGRASCRAEWDRTWRSRWSPYH